MVMPRSKWTTGFLGDIAEEIRVLYEPISSEDLPYIGLGHIDQQTMRILEIGHSSSTDSTKKVFQAGEILFGSLRPYFRKVVRPKFGGVCSTDITVLRARPGVDPRFLLYLVGSPQFISYATSVSSGTRMPRTNWNVAAEFECAIPDLDTQRKIGSILSAYDDLIENNLRRIAILEEMAQAIYREWFVEFRYPGYENTSMASSLSESHPEGWETVTVREVIQRIPAGKLYDTDSVSSVGRVPVLDQGRSGIIGYHDDDPGVLAGPENPVIVFANHTCYQRLVIFPFSSIQNVLPFVPSADRRRDVYWLHWATKDLIGMNDYKGHWPEFMGKQLLLPPPDICSIFGSIAGPIVRQTYLLGQINRELSAIRDILLPKLVFCELDPTRISAIQDEHKR